MGSLPFQESQQQKNIHRVRRRARTANIRIIDAFGQIQKLPQQTLLPPFILVRFLS
jgi:hypothetical protein